MIDLVIQRLTAAGWMSGRKVDISSIEEASSKAGMTIPAKLRDFFVEFGYLSISYKTRDGVSEYYSIDPRMDFCNWNKDDFQDFFIDYDITGMAYPVGFACRDNLTIYFHDDGHFYLYLSGGPLHRCRQSGEFF